jgi:hypothetical protein
MAKINQQGPGSPMWPWGGPRSVRERLVSKNEVQKKSGKTGNPKNPALASSALMDFIGPAHSSEELRLPLPPPPMGHDADIETFLDRPHLLTVAERAEQDMKRLIERGMTRINAPPDRLDRMKALLSREAQMLEMVDQVGAEMKEILRLMWDAQKDEGI